MMTMKNIFSRLAVVLMTAMAFAGFTSCGSDDNDNDQPESPEIWASSYVVTFELSDDVMNTADITAHIAAPDGSIREEKVTKAKMTWTLKGNKLPDKAGVLLTFVPKNNIDPDKVYDVGINGSIAVTSLKNDKVFKFESFGHDSNLSVKGDKLPLYYVGSGAGVAHGINAQGVPVKVDVDSFDFGFNGLWEWVAGWLNDEK